MDEYDPPERAAPRAAMRQSRPLLWPLPSEAGALMPEAVTVWHARLDEAAPHQPELARTLSPDETARALRFRFERDQSRFVAARGLLRALLSRMTGVAPERLTFDYNGFGKPALAKESGGEQVHFNVSHAGGLAVYALAWEREVGVDVEPLRRLPDMEELAARVFGPSERAALYALPATEQPKAFLNGWTRKEAVLKACGWGLMDDLHALQVTCAPGEMAQILQVPSSLPEASCCSLSELTVAPGYAAALASMEPTAPGAKRIAKLDGF